MNSDMPTGTTPVQYQRPANDHQNTTDQPYATEQLN